MNKTPTSSEDRGPLPAGLVLFPPGTSSGKKRRRILFVLAYLVVTASLVWPIYPKFSGIHPLVLGLPLSLAWIVLALVAGFAALLALYLTEDDLTEDDLTEGDTGPAAGEKGPG